METPAALAWTVSREMPRTSKRSVVVGVTLQLVAEVEEVEDELDSVLTLGFRFLGLFAFTRSSEDAASSVLRFLAYLMPQALQRLEQRGHLGR